MILIHHILENQIIDLHQIQSRVIKVCLKERIVQAVINLYHHLKRNKLDNRNMTQDLSKKNSSFKKMPKVKPAKTTHQDTVMNFINFNIQNSNKDEE